MINESPANAIVGQTSSKILDGNEWRIGLFIRNLSDNTVHLGFDHAAEIDKGITLFSKECYSMGNSDPSTADIYAIATGDNSLVAIQEYSSRRCE